MGFLTAIAGPIWLIFNAGAAVLLFFIILAGAKESFPLSEFYWLQADTSGIPGAHPVSRWTFYGICAVSDNGRNTNCTSNRADFPFDPANQFGTHTGVPNDFIDSRNTYYYLSRFAYPLFLIGLAFTVFAFFLSFFAFRSRLAGAFSSLFSFVAWFFVTTAASLATSWVVLGRNHFNDVGPAKVGTKLIAFSWTSVVLLLFSFLFLCCTCCAKRRNRSNAEIAADEEFKAHGNRAPMGRGFFKPVKKNAPGNFFKTESEQPVVAEGERSSFERAPQ